MKPVAGASARCHAREVGGLCLQSQVGSQAGGRCSPFPISVLVSCACRNKLAQSWWPKTTEIYSQIWKLKSLKSSACRDTLSRKSLGKIFLRLSQLWWLLALVGLWPHHSNLCLCGPTSTSSRSNFLLLHLTKAVVIEFRPTG